MATATGTGVWIAKGVHQKTWTLTGTVTKGTIYASPNLPDKTWTVVGTFSPGCTVSIEGTNLPASGAGSAASGSWFIVNDTRGVGNSLTFATDGGKTQLENPICVRPRVTALTSTLTPSVVVRCTAQSLKR